MVPLDHALPAARMHRDARRFTAATPAAQCFMDCLHAARDERGGKAGG